MTTNNSINKQKFDWMLYLKAEMFIQKQIDFFLSNNPISNYIANKMTVETSTRFFDWVDHLRLPEYSISHEKINQLGFNETKTESHEEVIVYSNPQSVLPPVLYGGVGHGLAVKVDNLDLFYKVFDLKNEMTKESNAPLRISTIKEHNGYKFVAVERKGYNGFTIKETSDNERYLDAFKEFQKRPREYQDEETGFRELETLLTRHLKHLGEGRVTDAFFRAEREFWMSKNKTGQAQKMRQDKLGLGWSNIDHHAFRSSRRNFHHLMHILESLGFDKREAYYAGEQAGWGAQILEHPDTSTVIFADLDLGYDEKDIDFSSTKMDNNEQLGTVGLWVALHGDSVLQAGLHHIAVRFDFNKIQSDLQALGHGFRKPFSNFEFLKQAFNDGEMWSVVKNRIYELERSGKIEKEDYDRFLNNGALGSHLESIERRQGFKGFNQNSVSVIIKETDPRKQHHWA
jgi:hypothetical protein